MGKIKKNTCSCGTVSKIDTKCRPAKNILTKIEFNPNTNECFDEFENYIGIGKFDPETGILEVTIKQ